jgi:hypothetical protein
MVKFPASVQSMFRDFEQNMLQQEAARDRREKHYSSTVFEKGLRWRYWELKLKTRRIRFCYRTRPNCTGCYLTWVETITGRRSVKSQIRPHDKRWEAKEWNRRAYEEAKEKLKEEPNELA